MPFPYDFESNFEAGTLAEWTSETDVEAVLNVRHYSHLARYNAAKEDLAVGPIAPWRGAYCAEWDLVGDTADHTLTNTTIDVADTQTAQTRFYLFCGYDLRATATDIFNIYELQGTADAVENAVSLRITAAAGTNGILEIGVGNVAGTQWYRIERGRWYAVELVSNIVTTGTGTATLWIDGTQVAQVTTLTNTAVLQGVLGTQNTLATTLGHLFIDSFIFDENTTTRIGPQVDRFPDVFWVTKSTHICVGESELLNVTLMQGAGTDNVLQVFDTDSAYVLDEGNKVARLYNLTASEPPIDLADVPVCVRRGAYVQLTGTSPQALVHIGRSQGYRSAGRIRQHGANRKPHNLSQE